MDIMKIIFNYLILIVKKIITNSKWDFTFWVNISPSVRIISKKGSNFVMGLKLIIERFGDIYVGENANLIIGDRCYFNKDLTISCQEEIKIGINCMFGPNVKIYDNKHSTVL